MLEYILWDIKPIAFKISDFGLRWYGLLLATGFLMSYLTVRKIFLIEKISIQIFNNIAIQTLIWGLIGARLGHVLFYEPLYFFEHPIEIIKVWHGGLASHGATISIIILIFYLSKKHTTSIYWFFDRFAIGIPIAAAFIRIGNLMNSEIIGKPTSLPWAFIFTKEDNFARHPAQIYEAIVYFLLFIFLIFYYKKLKFKIPSKRIIAIFFIVVFLSRFIIEFVKAEQVDFEKNMHLNIGQILSIPFIIMGLYLFIISYKHTKIDTFLANKNIKSQFNKNL